MATQADLDHWRHSIRSIDAEILRLIGERMRHAERIGLHKKEQQLPVKDFRVEKQIIERARDTAIRIGVYPSLAEEVMTTLIKYSVLKQEELKRESLQPRPSDSSSVLIIGGAGNMGQWFAQFYESMGFSISILDEKAQGAKLLYPIHENIRKDLDKYSIIILATPMTATNEVLHTLADIKPKALIVEICSLKSPIATGIRAAVSAGLRLASMHPMFGPDTEILAGKNIVFCDAPGLHSLDLRQDHYLQTSAKLIVIPFEDHDRFMSYILGASHLINMIYSRLLSISGIPLATLKDIAGTTFLKQLEVTSKVVQENQDLYFDIQTLNSTTPELLKSLEAVMSEMHSILGREDRTEFRAFMGYAQSYFKEASPSS